MSITIKADSKYGFVAQGQFGGWYISDALGVAITDEEGFVTFVYVTTI